MKESKKQRNKQTKGRKELEKERKKNKRRE